jgi:aryl-alcohol dehydrogenase-like predicted oxidoreductase
MSRLGRRKFLGTAAAAGGALIAAGAAKAGGPSVPGPVDPLIKSPTDRVRLGRSGLRVSAVGVGTGSVGYAHQSNQTRLGQEAFTRLMRHALDRGVNFFDLADSYGSHPFFARALKGVPRERYVLQTKTSGRDAASGRKDVERFLKELETDYIDSLLVHCVTEPDWPTRYRGLLDALFEAKARGRVRAVGVTCHSFRALEASEASDWVQINQVRWNPRGAHMDADVEKARALFARMRARGQGVVGMKVVGQGDIVGRRGLSPEECFRFQIESGVVDAFVVGVESVGHIDQLLDGTQRALQQLGYRLPPSA